jgi:hypothetical protein
MGGMLAHLSAIRQSPAAFWAGFTHLKKVPHSTRSVWLEKVERPKCASVKV